MFKTIVLGMIICACPTLAQAQSPELRADWYGNGMHQYFNRQYSEAILSFSNAISVNPKDPRPYFYRGLAKSKCGGDGAADFQQGAFRESYESGRSLSSVNRSLERIQGPTRLDIERYRREARLVHTMKDRMPVSTTPPVIYGDMVDVDSIVPIIEQIPNQNLVPQNSARPNQTSVPRNDPPSEDFSSPQPDSREVIPTEAVPEPAQPGAPRPGDQDSVPPPPPTEDSGDPFGI